MEQLLQQSSSTSSAPATAISPGTLAGTTPVVASESVHVASQPGENPPPPRRRLVKAAARALAESKRDGVGGPPGFSGAVIFDRNATPAPSLAGSGIAPSGSISSGLAAVPGSLPATFRERERVALRSSAKADLVGDQLHGTSGPSKSGRSAHANAGPLEARQLGRRPEVNVRRHDPSGAQKHAAEQAKRASVNRAQTSGAPGNYRSFDSLHNNFLVPVIPLQFAVKP